LCGNKALKEAFPYLYCIACAKDASVSTHLEPYVGSNQWNINFAIVVHDQEVNVFALIFNLLYSIRMKRVGKEALVGTFQKRVVRC
jgi:hypothetical protein